MSRIPFDPAEVENADIGVGMFGRPLKIYRTPVTPKENYRMVYERKVPHWLPMSGDMLMITPRVDPDNIARAFCFEANPLAPEEMIGGLDKFGIEWVYVPVATGSMVRPGNPVLEDVNAWKEKIKFPDIDSWDWDGSKAANADHTNTDKFLAITILTGFFERLVSFMDFENAALALIDDDQKDAVHDLFDALADVYIKMVDKFVWAYNIDILSLHDDWGAQRAPFFSLDTCLEMIVPHIKKVSDYCHSCGIFFDLHSCGKNEMLVPAYIAAGCDSWGGQPINDKNFVYENYGDKLLISIEPDVASDKFPPPPIEPEAAVASAKRLIDKYGPSYATKPFLGGFFFGPPEYTDVLYAESRKLFNTL